MLNIIKQNFTNKDGNIYCLNKKTEIITKENIKKKSKYIYFRTIILELTEKMSYNWNNKNFKNQLSFLKNLTEQKEIVEFDMVDFNFSEDNSLLYITVKLYK